MSGSSHPSTKGNLNKKDFLFPRHFEINQWIIEDETPKEYWVTFAIGDFQKSLRFVSAGLLHTAIIFAQKLSSFPMQGSPVHTDHITLLGRWALDPKY